ETTTYQTIAEKIGKIKAVRAVGAANGRNRIAIIVPCHRVLGSDGKLRGYGGGVERKEWLLNHEKSIVKYLNRNN
ncbi:MAG: methylated-DNA--[protein]-cysteine S-methyltransferase, partial [Bacteroidota bacterium]